MAMPTRECVVCLIAQPEQEFYPTYSTTCQHMYRYICNSCTYYSVKVILDSAISSQVSCPETNCPAKWSSNEVRQVLLVNNDHLLLNKYDANLIRQFLESDDNFFWCAHGCGSGQYDYTISIRNSKMTCIACKKETCAFHRVKWHEGMTCDQYEQWYPSTDTMTRQWIETHTKKCPGCQCNIEKNGGCNRMTCKKCGRQFTWDDLFSYTPLTNYWYTPHQYDRGGTINYNPLANHTHVPHEMNHRPHRKGKLASLLRLLKLRRH
ncbi:unnamed protein product [Rotaria sp. Silwood1]|nr:unnamed protein product [Rotaria sp. Silwood1]CAF1152243.1 unnamed protein product [Rotaria sp. Silwood1]CAF3441176.1 unnamed protein product [Rotaria sp. Silwood1]CAF3471790.1 unnamed protein product [Rotaria sp. Silwood1]CAF4747434.1 unnamed protein product [Rotaria sp. Silwood1]